MKTVKALVAFSNGVISMEQYEVRELPTDMANDLIAAGICVDAAGGSGGGVLVVHDVDGTLDKTWQEIHDAMLSGGAVVSYSGKPHMGLGSIVASMYNYKGGEYIIVQLSPMEITTPVVYSASSADGYPTLSE